MPRRRGIYKLILPEDNRHDLDDIPGELVRKTEFSFVRSMDEVLPLALLVIFLILAVASRGRERQGLLRDIVLALVGSILGALLLAWLFGEAIPNVLPEVTTESPEPAFPILRVAALTAVMVVAAPHLTRPLRRFGWFIVLLVAVAGTGLGLGWPSDALGGIGLGLVVGGTIMLIFGSPKGYPAPAEVASALADLGVEVTVLAPDAEALKAFILEHTP